MREYTNIFVREHWRSMVLDFLERLGTFVKHQADVHKNLSRMRPRAAMCATRYRLGAHFWGRGCSVDSNNQRNRFFDKKQSRARYLTRCWVESPTSLFIWWPISREAFSVTISSHRNVGIVSDARALRPHQKITSLCGALI